jgi:aspartyl-tRNA(Asn)/glutamyl-tRNA(Gln) amidotransferase subunit A
MLEAIDHAGSGSVAPVRSGGQDNELCADWTVADLVAAFIKGTLSPVDAAEAALQRIKIFDTDINAFVHLDPEVTLAQARESENRYKTGKPLSPIDGIPTSIKDLQPVAGWPIRRGSLALAPDQPAPADSPPVARLREAGAVFIGKTATPESGSRIVTRSAVHGVTVNPYDLSLTPGGSSGGASAALALGMGALAIGTDGAGSIRIPAAYCNVAGLKPGFGRIPSYPPSIFMPHSVTGPMARTVADVAAMAAIMSRPEPRDPYAWPVPFDATATSGSVAGLRVALSPTLGTKGRPDGETLSALSRAADMLRDAGADVGPADPAWPVDPHEPFMVFWEATYAGFLDSYPPDVAAKMDPLLQDIAARGRKIDIVTYHRAMAQRIAIAAASKDFYRRFDAVLAPVMPGPAFGADTEAPVGERPDDWRWCPFTYIANMTGEPAASVPAGFTPDGLPLGVQIMGPMGSEENLLRLSRAIENRSDCAATRPAMLAR